MKKRAAAPQQTSEVKREAVTQTSGKDAKEHGTAEGVVTASPNVLELVRQLQMQAMDANIEVSRPAFEALIQIFQELFAWVRTMAALHTMSLGALTRCLPEQDAWKQYNDGEHVGAWAGIQLARLYKQFNAELRSRSKDCVNRLRDVRFGFKAHKIDLPANPWFRDEYERRTDYRPTGRMALWVALKIEEVRRLKENRSRWRQFAAISVVEKQLRLLSETQTEAVLSEWFPSEVVRGEEALKLLDSLPRFGDSGALGSEAWRKFIRRRFLVNPNVLEEFDQTFPGNRRKLDGVIAATLRYAWQAIHRGGNVIIP
jgi:hypothetical protein